MEASKGDEKMNRQKLNDLINAQIKVHKIADEYYSGNSAHRTIFCAACKSVANLLTSCECVVMAKFYTDVVEFCFESDEGNKVFSFLYPAK